MAIAGRGTAVPLATSSFGPTDILSVHPAVARYRQTNRRQGDKFEKKNYFSIYF